MVDSSNGKKFDKKLATYQVWLGVMLALGGALLAAGIAFLTTGATEINHASLSQGELQNKTVESGVRFIESGWNLFVAGLILVIGSGYAFSFLIERIRSSVQLENKSQNTQLDSDSLKMNNLEEEIKNAKIRLEIENLKVEFTNLKLELATLKLEQIKVKTNSNNRKRK